MRCRAIPEMARVVRAFSPPWRRLRNCGLQSLRPSTSAAEAIFVRALGRGPEGPHYPYEGLTNPGTAITIRQIPSFVVGPHAKYLDDMLFFEDLIDKPVLDVDAAGICASQVA